MTRAPALKNTPWRYCYAMTGSNINPEHSLHGAARKRHIFHGRRIFIPTAGDEHYRGTHPTARASHGGVHIGDRAVRGSVGERDQASLRYQGLRLDHPGARGGHRPHGLPVHHRAVRVSLPPDLHQASARSSVRPPVAFFFRSFLASRGILVQCLASLRRRARERKSVSDVVSDVREPQLGIYCLGGWPLELRLDCACLCFPSLRC